MEGRKREKMQSMWGKNREYNTYVERMSKTKAEMTIEEFLKKDRGGREVMRRILKAREERRWNRKEEGRKRRGKGRERNNK